VAKRADLCISAFVIVASPHAVVTKRRSFVPIEERERERKKQSRKSFSTNFSVLGILAWTIEFTPTWNAGYSYLYSLSSVLLSAL